MITDVFVDGYKSLSKFHLSVRPGLNVLVGPNGSGKSNVLSLFELLSYVSRYRLPEAVSRAGGAGNLFRRLPKQEISDRIKIRVDGRGKGLQNYVRRFSGPGYARRTPEHYIEYSYSAEIHLGEGGTSLNFHTQRLSFSAFKDPSKKSLINRKTGEKRWHVDLNLTISDRKINILTNKVNYTAIKSATGIGLSTIPDYFFYDEDELSNIPLFNILDRVFPSVSKIQSDISYGHIYNLNPSEIKKPEDIARPAEISQNGSGLAATLFNIQERQSRRYQNGFGPYIHETPEYSVSLKNLKQIFCLINDNIVDVRVQNDAMENKLIVISQIKFGDDTIEVPMTMLSDGTVKWFSLVTAILSRKAIFAIEEPENFLHPHMQKEVVDILRRNAQSNSDIFALLTTHSESLLNALDPDEVVVTTMENGATRTFRSADAELIRNEINESGFGLGYFYISGVLTQ